MTALHSTEGSDEEKEKEHLPITFFSYTKNMDLKQNLQNISCGLDTILPGEQYHIHSNAQFCIATAGFSGKYYLFIKWSIHLNV